MPLLIDAQSLKILGEITPDDLHFLFEHLIQEDAEDPDFFVDGVTYEMLHDRFNAAVEQHVSQHIRRELIACPGNTLVATLEPRFRVLSRFELETMLRKVFATMLHEQTPDLFDDEVNEMVNKRFDGCSDESLQQIVRDVLREFQTHPLSERSDDDYQEAFEVVLRPLYTSELQAAIDTARAESHLLDVLRTAQSVPTEVVWAPDDVHALLRLQILAGRNLVIRDLRTSDPYCIVEVHAPGHPSADYRTATINNSLNPTWNEECQFLVSPDSRLELRVMDRDRFTSDDPMGRWILNLKDVTPDQPYREWVDLTDVEDGQLHLAWQLKPLAPPPDALRLNRPDDVAETSVADANQDALEVARSQEATAPTPRGEEPA